MVGGFNMPNGLSKQARESGAVSALAFSAYLRVSSNRISFLSVEKSKFFISVSHLMFALMEQEDRREGLQAPMKGAAPLQG